MSHLETLTVPAEYKRYTAGKVTLILIGVALLAALTVISISLGAVNLPISEVFKALIAGDVSARCQAIVMEIRLPQALTAIMAGVGLAVAGVVMQSILRNPLGSPFTLGISNAAAFGAAFSVMVLGTGDMTSHNVGAINISNPYMTTICAFVFSLASTFVIIAVSKIRGSTSEVMILTGVALGALFTAGTMFLQYFADDVQLAAMVFWTFGDVARASWNELGYMASFTGLAIIYFFANRWNYNAIDAGDETAKGLGVRVDRVRLWGMLISSMLTAVIVAFLGIIGFVGLVCPHMVRRILGDDNRFLIPGTCVVGGILLLGADTAARLVLAPNMLPVSVLTAFLGAPVFIYLLITGYRR